MSAGDRLYFDHNASTPPDPETIEQFVEFERRAPANPGSLHGSGRRARELLEDARGIVADTLGIQPDDVLVVSGGTEANNLAVRSAGAVDRPAAVSAAEHPSVFEAAVVHGHVELPLDAAGRVDFEPLAREATSIGLLCVVHGQNEVGVVQDVRRAGEWAARLGVPLHVDTAQTIGRLPLGAVVELANTFVASPHKFGGLRGSGFLLGRGVRDVQPLMFGGGQEFGLRPGTPSAALAAANAHALARAVRDQSARAERMRAARRVFEDEVRTVVARFLTPPDGLPNTSMCQFDDLEGRSLLPALDMAGVEASIGSACSSGSPLPPRVLGAMGLDDATARRCVRFSFSHTTTSSVARDGARRVAQVVARLRSSTR